MRGAVAFIAEEGCPSYFAEVADLLGWAYLQGFITVSEILSFFDDACEKSPISSELRSLAGLCGALDSAGQEHALPNLQSATVAYFSDSVYDEVTDEDIFSSLAPDDTYGAEQRLFEVISDKILDLGISLDEGQISEIAEVYDVRERMDEYFKEDNYKSDIATPQSSDNIDEIEDLFDRSELDKFHEPEGHGAPSNNAFNADA